METQKQVRKSYSPKGTRSQVRQTLMIDNANADWLAPMINKSRYVNDLLTNERQKSGISDARYIVRKLNGKSKAKVVAIFESLSDALFFINAKHQKMRNEVSPTYWPKDYRNDGQVIRLQVIDRLALKDRETVENIDADPWFTGDFIYDD